MYSSSNFQRLWFLCKTENAPKGISHESFGQTNGIPYEPFGKWFGKYHKSVMPIRVDGMSEEPIETKRSDVCPPQKKLLQMKMEAYRSVSNAKKFSFTKRRANCKKNTMPVTIGISKVK